MAVDVKKVLREKPGSFLCYFLPLLVMAENNVELLDVLELFGLDRLSEALARLGGSRITFPTWAAIDAIVKDAYLVARLETVIGPALNAQNKAALEAEFEAPLELLLFRARSIKNLLRHCGDHGTYRSKPLPGEREMKRYLQKIKKTNGEIRRAVKAAEKEEDELGSRN